MNEKSIAQALKEQADAIQKLAQRIAREGKALSLGGNIQACEEMSDDLFAFQSKLRYDYKWIAEDIWGD